MNDDEDNVDSNNKNVDNNHGFYNFSEIYDLAILKLIMVITAHERQIDFTPY